MVAWTDEVAERRAARVHVKLDTGMGRLGTKDRRPRAASSAAPAERGGADDPLRHGRRARRRALPRASSRRFRSFVDDVGRDDLRVHAANSAATLREPAAHFDLVRCGIAIYGMDPFGADPAEHGLEPALSLHS